MVYATISRKAGAPVFSGLFGWEKSACDSRLEDIRIFVATLSSADGDPMDGLRTKMRTATAGMKRTKAVRDDIVWVFAWFDVLIVSLANGNDTTRDKIHVLGCIDFLERRIDSEDLTRSRGEVFWERIAGWMGSQRFVKWWTKRNFKATKP